jgi:hypothetical protein
VKSRELVHWLAQVSLRGSGLAGRRDASLGKSSYLHVRKSGSKRVDSYSICSTPRDAAPRVRAAELKQLLILLHRVTGLREAVREGKAGERLREGENEILLYVRGVGRRGRTSSARAI